MTGGKRRRARWLETGGGCANEGEDDGRRRIATASGDGLQRRAATRWRREAVDRGEGSGMVRRLCESEWFAVMEILGE